MLVQLSYKHVLIQKPLLDPIKIFTIIVNIHIVSVDTV